METASDICALAAGAEPFQVLQMLAALADGVFCLNPPVRSLPRTVLRADNWARARVVFHINLHTTHT